MLTSSRSIFLVIIFDTAGFSYIYYYFDYKYIYTVYNNLFVILLDGMNVCHTFYCECAAACSLCMLGQFAEACIKTTSGIFYNIITY